MFLDTSSNVCYDVGRFEMSTQRNPKMTNSKYPNWQIEKDGRGYIMTRPDWEAQGTYYAIGVDQDENSGEWIAELNTMGTDCYGRRGWGFAKNQAYGTALEVTAEAERRARYWIAKRAN